MDCVLFSGREQPVLDHVDLFFDVVIELGLLEIDDGNELAMGVLCRAELSHEWRDLGLVLYLLVYFA